ncbi:hypothetical protein V5N11_011110 [Cardamine amara subsp. amara]|uniref:Retroviral polymerase SH3-like domain-containing protein n=1 Tax=Cardamine amara subsp. amara TaxID=228776 RepID=A0ABD1B6X4_CARAN
MWIGNVPSLSFPKIRGCEAYVKHLISDKLAPRSNKCCFAGFTRETKAYYFYNRYENKVFVAKNYIFLREIVFPRRIVGVKYNSKKFENHRRLLNLLRENSTWIYKEL